MNQLEFFVASTEYERWQCRRCLRAIRVLDDRIDYSLTALQTITELRGKHLASSSSAATASSSRGMGVHSARGGRKRVRSPDDGGRHAANAEAELTSVEDRMEALKKEFDSHRATVMRLAREREGYARLLGECGDSMRRCAATRLLQSQQVVDNEKKPVA